MRVDLEGATRLDTQNSKYKRSPKLVGINCTARAHIGRLNIDKMAVFAVPVFLAPAYPIEYPPAPVSGGYILQNESQAPQLTTKMGAGMMSSNS